MTKFPKEATAHIRLIWSESAPTFYVYAVRNTLQIALVLLTTKLLGPSQLGTLATFSGVATALGSMATLGQGFILLKHEALRDPETKNLLTLAPAITLASSICLTGLFLLIAHSLIPAAAGLDVLILIAFSDLLLLPLTTLFAHSQQGRGETAKSQLTLQIHIAVRVGVLLLTLPFAQALDLRTYATLYAVSALIAAIASIPWKRMLEPTTLNMTDVITYIKQGAPFAMMKLGTLTPNELDKLISFRLLGSSETGIYAITSKGVSVASIPAHVLSLVFQRNVISAHAENDKPKLYETLKMLVLSTFMYSICAGAALYIFGPWVTSKLLGPDFDRVTSAIQLLAISAVPLSMRFCVGNCLIAMQTPFKRMIAELTGFLVLLITALFAVQEYGLNGFLSAVLASEFYMSLLMLHMLISETRRLK